MTDKRKNVMKKVAALIAQAESTEFSAERDAFRAKADDLMLRYAIEEAEIAMADGGQARVTVRNERVNVAGPDSPYREELVDMMALVARHARCQLVFHGYTDKAMYPVEATLVGMDADLEYVKMLFNSLRLQLASELEPKWDPAKSLRRNVFAMRTAGLGWNRLEKLCGLPPGGKARQIYYEACDALGQEPKRINSKTVKRNFARGFVVEIGNRLRSIRRAQEEQSTASGNALVLVRDQVADEMKTLFPNVRQAAPKKRGKADSDAMSRGVNAGRSADLGQTRVSGSKKGLPQ